MILMWHEKYNEQLYPIINNLLW